MRRLGRTLLPVCCATLAILRATPASAQYQPIPNYTGANAGLRFRDAINDRFSGNQPITPKIAGLSYASLPAEQDGLLIYCTDCKTQDPCTSGGSGAWALAAAGQWQCSTVVMLSGDVTGPAGANQVNAVLGGHTPLYDARSGATLADLASAPGGSSNIRDFNLNGAQNPRSATYNASGSAASCTGTVSASSKSLTVSGCSPSNDFAAGQGIRVAFAGASNTAGAPTAPSAALPAWPGAWSAIPYNSSGSGHQYIIQPVNNNAGGNRYEATTVSISSFGRTGGSEPNWGVTCPNSGNTCTDNGITWTQVTSTYATTWTYKLEGIDANGGASAATSAFTCTAASTLNEINPCVLAWTAGANNDGVRIFRSADGGTTWSWIADVPAADASFNDEGFSAFNLVNVDGVSNTPNASAQPAPLITTIDAVSGGTITLHVAATNAVTSKNVSHDDGAALNSWASALLGTSGSMGYCPTGTYYTASTVSFNPASAFYGGMHVDGPAGLTEAPAGCRITWTGPPSHAVLYTNGINNAYFTGLSIDANATAQYGFQFDNSGDGLHASNGIFVEHSSVINASPSINEVAAAIGHPGIGSIQVSDIWFKKILLKYYGVPNLANSGIETFNGGNIKDFYCYDINASGFHTALNFANSSGALIISGGNISNGTGPDINLGSAGEAGQFFITGMEDENDSKTGGSFILGGTGGGDANLVAAGNSWQGNAQSNDVVLNLGQLQTVLLGNKFENRRVANTSPARVEMDGGDATPGVRSGGLTALNNKFQNVASPYYPPIYDTSWNQVVNLVGQYPFNANGKAISVIAKGNYSNTSSGVYWLVDVDAWGGDSVAGRIFASGTVPTGGSTGAGPFISGFPILDVNGVTRMSAGGNLVNACKGDVTLAGGSGTFTNGCVTTASACTSRDITTPANACTVAAPAAGSVAITGTGTDVCRTWCE